MHEFQSNVAQLFSLRSRSSIRNICRVAKVMEKYQENEIFYRSGKSREFCGWPGKFRKDLESQGKVWELENKWPWQSVFRKFIYSVLEGKGCTFT